MTRSGGVVKWRSGGEWIGGLGPVVALACGGCAGNRSDLTADLPKSELVARTREAFTVGMPVADVESQLGALRQEWHDSLRAYDPEPTPARKIIWAPLHDKGSWGGGWKGDLSPGLAFLFDRESKLERVIYEDEFSSKTSVRQQVVP